MRGSRIVLRFSVCNAGADNYVSYLSCCLIIYAYDVRYWSFPNDIFDHSRGMCLFCLGNAFLFCSIFGKHCRRFFCMLVCDTHSSRPWDKTSTAKKLPKRVTSYTVGRSEVLRPFRWWCNLNVAPSDFAHDCFAFKQGCWFWGPTTLDRQLATRCAAHLLVYHASIHSFVDVFAYRCIWTVWKFE